MAHPRASNLRLWFATVALVLSAAGLPVRGQPTEWILRAYDPYGSPKQGLVVAGMLYDLVTSDTTDINGVAVLAWGSSGVPEPPDMLPARNTWGAIKYAFSAENSTVPEAPSSASPAVTPALVMPTLQEGQIYVDGMDTNWNWSRILPEETRYQDHDLGVMIPPLAFGGVPDLDAELVKTTMGAPPYLDNVAWPPSQYPIPVDGLVYPNIPFTQTQVDSICAAIDDINDHYRQFNNGIDVLRWAPGEVVRNVNGVWLWKRNSVNGTSFDYDTQTYEIYATESTCTNTGFNSPWIRRHELLRAAIGYAGNCSDLRLGVMKSSPHHWEPYDTAIGEFILAKKRLECTNPAITSELPEYNSTD